MLEPLLIPVAEGQHLSWKGPSMTDFWKNYLMESKKTEQEKDKFHLIFCPNDKWHRVADLWRNEDPQAHLKPVLTGYFYLPGRTTSSAEYDVSGVEDWVKRKKLGGRFKNAPILTDRLQGLGNWNGPIIPAVWIDTPRVMESECPPPRIGTGMVRRRVVIFYSKTDMPNGSDSISTMRALPSILAHELDRGCVSIRFPFRSSRRR